VVVQGLVVPEVDDQVDPETDFLGSRCDRGVRLLAVGDIEQESAEADGL
jgi:hypothetical protein